MVSEKQRNGNFYYFKRCASPSSFYCRDDMYALCVICLGGEYAWPAPKGERAVLTVIVSC